MSDPSSPVAAANGQYILVKRETYEAVGGHAGIAGDILEDVALARAVKNGRPQDSISVRRRRRPYTYVSQLRPASRRLDEKSRTIVSEARSPGNEDAAPSG